MIKDNTAPLFELGQIVAKPAAIKMMEHLKIAASQLLDRHVSGDFGDIDDEDQESNMVAVDFGLRILSAYKFGKQAIWIITEADRSSTCILLPSEY
jgi:hypothetical protein